MTTPDLLLVDNNNVSQRLMTKVLEQVGNVNLVNSTRDARINVNKVAFDCVVMSYELQRDEEFLSFVIDLRRSSNAMRHATIVFVTSDYSDDIAYRAYAAGVNYTLAKPFTKEKLIQILEAQIKAKGTLIKPISRTSATVSCLSWFSGGMHFVYSPDLNRLTSAPTRKESDAQMDQLLQQFHWQLRDSRWGEAIARLSRRRVVFNTSENEEEKEDDETQMIIRKHE